MPDIRESIQIDAPASKVSPLVSSGEGFSKWWAEDVVLRPEGVDRAKGIEKLLLLNVAMKNSRQMHVILKALAYTTTLERGFRNGGYPRQA